MMCRADETPVSDRADQAVSAHGEAARPSVVLICHEDDRIDAEGLSAWLASTMRLVGIVLVRESPGRSFVKARREIRRVGWWRFADVVAFRLYYRLRRARRDAHWAERELAQLRARYPADTTGVERLRVRDPNCAEVRAFLSRLGSDLVIARCKFILEREIFQIPARGTYVLHPGVCPEYRNAHGCFWALVNRDLERVGMTLLRVDDGVDTGAVLLQASCPFDERCESPMMIQYRVVLENLDRIAETLRKASTEEASILPVKDRESRAWGQPWLSAYLKWRWTLATETR
ncbi:MAG: formyltransferase family protein [Gammaproteobacteria bacterium]